MKPKEDDNRSRVDEDGNQREASPLITKESERSNIQRQDKFYIPDYFKIVERNTYLLFLGVMLVVSFFAQDVLVLIGEKEFSTLISSIEALWPKFVFESRYLAGSNSGVLWTYKLAQVIFPPLSIGVTLFLYILVSRRGELTDPVPFVWRAVAIPYVALFAFLFTYLVSFNVMDFERGFIATRLYGTKLLYFWLPLTYLILVSIYLRLVLLITLLFWKE